MRRPQYYQANYYSGGSSGSLIDVDGTDWANLPSNVPDYMMIYRNVARAIAPSFTGDPLPLTYYSIGQSYSKTFDFTIDPSWDVNNLIFGRQSLNQQEFFQTKELMGHMVLR